MAATPTPTRPERAPDAPRPLRFSLHVHPGSRHAGVGGSHDGDLVVRVRARAVSGAATAEALSLVAAALEVSASAVTLEHGGRSRTKLVAVAGDEARLRARLRALLDVRPPTARA
ncbi:MAG TPA: DUF167 domain-containing protein [Acidimicrobiales bacterium]|nr:DUF167 domain-containing protein [Acidimicrobiales bacterium]